MGQTNDILNDVRGRIDAHAEPLAEARGRLRLSRDVAIGFRGALRTYPSGSLAQHTFIHPVADGDGGVVLDRRVYPALGPEGADESPEETIEALCSLLGPKIRNVYPKARCCTSRRGPKIYFGRPVDSQDPTIDLVMALTRRDGNGLWIPDLKKNKWEASDPERHATLFTSGGKSHAQTRRRTIRLLKAWNRQYTTVGFSSHNLSVWAWEFITEGMGLPTALFSVLDRASTRLEAGYATKDPAGVSPHVKPLIDRSIAARRLRTAADAVSEALQHDDDREAVLSALSRVYWKYLEDPTPSGLAGKAAMLRRPTPVSTAALGLSGRPALVRPTRAYGTPLRSA
ncbi:MULTISPECIES: hypothetical protein [Protofrankia]|uniref:Uncharacterized protein n=1 Tax=Protofrankia coriariae TaxID=1562887 RepID=A0ABR5EYW8_9ACTN|nr:MULTISPECIES: hypothetical protein [Protofrankia]KLL09667.1 hypothetical protein FrCorBMG51_23235 [Protofrankia coriariae]ONH31101.1 hypothetical protein BL254_23450 [Protofrankia sp. BMG5.30]